MWYREICAYDRSRAPERKSFLLNLWSNEYLILRKLLSKLKWCLSNDIEKLHRNPLWIRILVFNCRWNIPLFSKDKEAYIYIETSSPRMYSEKARLNSPRKTGPQRMEFLYSMYSSTIETLSVYIKINGSEYRVWSRYGSQLSSDWIKGCVTLNYQGTYQVKTCFLYQLFCVCLFVCL